MLRSGFLVPVSLACVAALLAAQACGGGDTQPGTSSTGTSTASGGAGGGGGSTSGTGAATGGSATGGTGGTTTVLPEDFEGVDVTVVPLGQAPAGCQTFDAATGKLTLTLDAGTPNVLVGMAGGVLQANGVPCVGATAEALVSLAIQGSDGDNTVILDLATGPFGDKVFGAGGGITVDLGAGSDAFLLRGSYGADGVHAGTETGKSAFDINGDGKPDTFVTAATALTLTVSLGPGDDTFSAAGIGAGAPLAHGISVFGGDGNDVLAGGDGDDTLHGGKGDDVFKTATKPDGADTYDGGEGVDTVSYEHRTKALTVKIDDQANDGEAGENDDVTTSIEVVSGGAGNDVIEGSSNSETLYGGPGNDVLRGGEGDDFLYGDAGDDQLEGGLGDDSLDGGEGQNRLDGGGGDGDICFGNPSDVYLTCELM